MARTTLSTLQAEISALRAEIVELRSQNVVQRAAPKGACTVYVDGKPRVSAFSHRVAYEFMRTAQEAGHHAMYRPVAA